MEITNSMKVEKFDGRNFKQWKFQVKCALRAKGLDIYTPKPSDTLAQAEWNKQDGMAMFILTSSMDLHQISLIETCETAKDVMSKLEAIYEHKSEFNKMIVHEQFYQYTYCSSDSMAQHVSKVEGLAKQLRECGEKLSDMAVITKILSTLPPAYRSLRQAWLSLDPDHQNIQNLTSRLIDEEASLMNEKSSESALVISKKNPRPIKHSAKSNTNSTGETNNNPSHRFVCYNCNKRGHFARECRAPKKSVYKKQEQRNMLAFSAEKSALSVTDDNVWILDSGASMHMTYKREYFCEFNEYHADEKNRTVKLGNKHDIEVCGEGSILIERKVNGQWEESILENVIYVPELRRNLFSEGAATRRGYMIIKNNKRAQIVKNNIVVMQAHLKENNLYELEIKTVLRESCNIVQTDIKLWHDRLGHINVKEIQNMSKIGAIPVAVTGNDNFFCEACQFGKQSRLPFHKSRRGPTKPGDIVYSDVCGPIEEPSVSGKRYFLLFKDGATSFRHVYFLRYKSEVLDYFKKYNAIVNNQFEHNVRILHTDNGREYINNDFKDFLESKGISHECTAPYTPQQNGRAERELRTIMESARTMLYAKDTPFKLWAEAVNCAVYLLNRSSSSQTGDVSPYELWFNQRPSLKHIRIFGSVGYVHIPKEKRKKLDKKSSKMILVGYEYENYRMYDQDSNTIVVSRDVKFDENSSVTEQRQNYVEIKINNMNIEEQPSSIQEERSSEEPGNPDTSSDESMKSTEDQDVSYRPPRHVVLEERSNVTTRSRRNRNIELNLSEVDIPNTYEEAVTGNNSQNWKKAIEEELRSHERNNTWTLTQRTDKKPITCKWVFCIKRNKEGGIERYKARLCARGFTQVKGLDYTETFSPTTRYDSIRILLSVAASKGLEIEQFDVKTAFLYGELLEEIYMEPPEGIENDASQVCKLNKSLYGLKQASRCWNKKFTSFLTTYGFKPCPSDNCVFIGYFNSIKVLLILYVDDGLLLAKDKEILNIILQDLRENFEIKVLQFNSFVGMEINKTKHCITINQKHYIENLINNFNMYDAKGCSTPVNVNVQLCKNEKETVVNFPYREAVGVLLFLSTVSRPDIAYAVNLVSRYVSNPGTIHVNAVKRIIRYLICTRDKSIVYDCNSELVGYSDSDFAGDLDSRKSNTGYIFLMNGGPVTWASRKQNTTALSTTESEYMAASDAAKEILWLKQFLLDIGEPQNYVTLYIDNQSAIKLIHNPVFHKRSKHIDVRYNFIREKVDEKIIIIKYVESLCQLADFLTKALPPCKFNFIRDSVMKM